MSLLENAEGSGRAATLQAAEFLKTYLEYHSYCDEDVSSVLSVSTTPTTKNSVMTRAMHEALARWQESIQCPLCWHPLCQPVSLPCAHTFCLDCIDAHVDRAWTCPIPNCNMPVTMKNPQGAKFRLLNPTMETAVSAWSNYCHTLMHAPNEWWRNLSQNDDDDEDGTDKDKRRMACGDDHETQSNDGTFATAQEEVGDDIFSSRYLF